MDHILAPLTVASVFNVHQVSIVLIILLKYPVLLAIIAEEDYMILLKQLLALSALTVLNQQFMVWLHHSSVQLEHSKTLLDNQAVNNAP